MIIQIVKTVPRWILIAVLLIVVVFVVFTVRGATQPAPTNDPDKASKNPIPDVVMSLFNRPVRVKADGLGADRTCALSGALITVGNSTCYVTVPDSSDKARELRLAITTEAPVTFAVEVDSKIKSKVGHKPEVSLGLTEKQAKITISCASGCTLTVKS